MSATELPVEPWRRLGALLRSGEMLRVETLGVDAGRVCWVSGTVLAVETVHVAGQRRRHGVRWTAGLGCRRRERWLISRNTRRGMSLRCIAATLAPAMQACRQSNRQTAARHRGFARYADTTTSDHGWIVRLATG